MYENQCIDNSIYEDKDVLNNILFFIENGEDCDKSHSGRNIRATKENRPCRSVPYLNNPLLHELCRGKENKLNDLNKSVPAHLLAKISSKYDVAPFLWKKLWTERRIFDVMSNSRDMERLRADSVLVSCISKDFDHNISSEKYSPISDWSYYIWWLFSRRLELSKLSPKLPGHIMTAIASMEWKLLPSTRPDVLSEFISNVDAYKLKNPPPDQIERSEIQKKYFEQYMNDLRSGLQDTLSDWLLPYLRSKKIKIESFGKVHNIKNNAGSTRGSADVIKEDMPVENIPSLICRDIDRSQVRKKGHANLVPTHLFPHSNSSDCCLQNQVYQNVFVEEYSSVNWSLVSSLPKIDIKEDVQVQFTFRLNGESEPLHWVTGKIDSISSETGEVIIVSDFSLENGKPIKKTTTLNNFLPPSIPTFELKEDWWRLLPLNFTEKDSVPGSVVVYKSKNSENFLLDGVIVKTNYNGEDSVKVRRISDGVLEEVKCEKITHRIFFDIHPIRGDYDAPDNPLSTWTWCIPRPFQGENSKGIKGRLLLWFVSAEIEMIRSDSLLCVSIQPDIPFNYGYIWGPLPITCFIDVQNVNPAVDGGENNAISHEIESILDTPLCLLV
ncbi:hypothetical protein FG386_001421 [Cryptosporidium ryanae]|uniref:uncharacterized protein n=1 Tax=Cryptosporidium ryanae TaxID=515981 RepID=UPI00351A5B94|nr:hypothetical protein FG386_001421 [Cryptosporidium ryanae]